ncbi:MAG: apolipoprotein N-acyltransferase [Paracoccaceae bacterium]
MSNARRLLAPAPLPLLAGVAVAPGQAPFGFWALSLVGLALLVWLVASAPSPALRLARGWWAGVGYFALALFWIIEPFLVLPEQDGWMAPFALVFMAAGMALFWGGAAVAAGLGTGLRSRALGFALGLGLADLARSYLFTGFPWALVGHIWIDTPLSQLLAYVGPIGLSALTALVAGLPVMMPRMAGLGLATLTLAIGWGAGQWRLDLPDPERDTNIRVRLVQPNAIQRQKWDPGMWDVFVERLMDDTAAPAEQPLDLVIWPETAVPYLLLDAGPLLAEAAQASGGVPLVLGIQRDEGMRYYNSIAFVDGQGLVGQIHDKAHLVPFGEYVPFGDLLAKVGISAFAAQEGNGYSPGPGLQLLDLGKAGRVLPLICYEAICPQDLRAAAGRADWILQVTNDGWFGAYQGPFQHLALARMRAIEQGLPFLRAANTGISVVIDAKGRIQSSLGLGEQGRLDADVPGAMPRTYYTRFGDIPAQMAILVLLFALWLHRRRSIA